MATKAQIFIPALSGLRFDGVALNGGKVYFTEPGLGINSLRTVYTTRNKTTPAANPFILDTNGQGEVFLDGLYDVIVKTSADVTKATWENYEGSSVDSTISSLIEVDTSGGNVAKTLPTDSSLVRYVKTTADANVVTFTTSDGSTIAETGLQLDVDNLMIVFVKYGNVWYREQ